jgi:hypothetical protein
MGVADRKLRAAGRLRQRRCRRRRAGGDHLRRHELRVPGPRPLAVRGTDFAFTNGSDIIGTGVVLVITDDRTYDDVEELSRSDPDWNGDEEWSEVISPAAGVAPGNTYEWVTDLAAGSHYVVCIGSELESFFYGGGFTVEP